MQMKLHHLLHEYFMKPQLRSFQLAEPGAGAGPWPLVPRARGDRNTRAAVCPGQQCLVSSPLLDVTRLPPLLCPPRAARGTGAAVPGCPGGPGAGAGEGDAECVAAQKNGVCHANRLLCFPRRSSSSSSSGPACSLELSFPPGASLRCHYRPLTHP